MSDRKYKFPLTALLGAGDIGILTVADLRTGARVCDPKRHDLPGGGRRLTETRSEVRSLSHPSQV
jgi:hypothetical protein